MKSLRCPLTSEPLTSAKGAPLSRTKRHHRSGGREVPGDGSRRPDNTVGMRRPDGSSRLAANPRRLTDQLALLSEMTRLRLLRVLEKAELSVNDLATVLQLPQSTVSRHLKALLEAGWLVRRSEGTMGRYGVAADQVDPAASELWSVVSQHLGETPQTTQDANRLDELLTARRMDTVSYFGRVGGEWDAVRRELFGSTFVETALLGLLPPEWVVADLGCGTGNITSRLAGQVRRVHAVDMSPQMLAAARKRTIGLSNIEFHRADVTAVPLPDGSVDAVVISLVLHHVEHPEAVIREASRILARGGRLLIVDMLEHGRDEYRRMMGHRWMGFAPATVESWLVAADLRAVRIGRLPSDPDAKGPELFAATGSRA